MLSEHIHIYSKRGEVPTTPDQPYRIRYRISTEGPLKMQRDKEPANPRDSQLDHKIMEQTEAIGIKSMTY